MTTLDPRRRVRCLLIRHAQSQPEIDVDPDDWLLSDLGRRQAKALRDALRGEGIGEIYASPLPRAVATVRPLAEVLGLDIAAHDGLRERRLSGALIDDWREQHQRSWTDFDRVLPGGESSREAQARMLAGLQEILSEARSQTVAVCSHGNVISLALNALDPSFGFSQWQAMRNPHVFRLAWTPAGLELDAPLADVERRA